MSKGSQALVFVSYGLLLIVVYKLIFAIWFGWSWPQRLEAAATEQIYRPSKVNDVVVMYDRNERSSFILDLVMSAPVTAVVPFWNDQTRFVSIKAETGIACEGPLAFKKHAFVQLGLFDHCLIRQETEEPANALVLELNREHGLNSMWAGIFGIRYSWDHNGQFGHDQAWQYDLFERINYEEVLLGRAVAAELYSDDNKGVAHFWPDMPEIERQRRALRDRSAPVEETKRWAYTGSRWYDAVHETPNDLAYALLSRALNVTMDLAWLKIATPDPLRGLDYAEKLMYSKVPIERNQGENLLHFFTYRAECHWPESCKPPSDALSVAIRFRSLEILGRHH